MKDFRKSSATWDRCQIYSTLARWRSEQIILFQRAATGSAKFYEQTAQALVELIDLDQGMVLLRRDANWEVLASVTAPRIEPRPYSRTLVEQIAQNRRTYFQIAVVPALSKSLLGIDAVVGSPVFDAQGQVIGAIYGSRGIGQRSRGSGIAPLEAQMVQLLASAIGVGLARLESETRLIRQRTLIEQVFSADLAQMIEREPDTFFEGARRNRSVRRHSGLCLALREARARANLRAGGRRDGPRHSPRSRTRWNRG